MIKHVALGLLALLSILSIRAEGQTAFTALRPSDLGLAPLDGPVNGVFNIGSHLGANDTAVTLNVSNAHVSSIDTWTVAEDVSGTFTLGGAFAVEGFVSHGRNLGSEGFANGSLARDGVLTAPGESWTLISTLDSDYTAGQAGDDYFVDYTGFETSQLESNSTGFTWRSDQPVSTFTVYSMNSVNLDNNYLLGFRLAQSVPEPSSTVFLPFAGLVVLRRHRSGKRSRSTLA